MNCLRINDNSKAPKSNFSAIPNLAECLADKTLEQLDREGVFMLSNAVQDADDVTEDQMVLQSVNGQYQTGNIMGFFGLGDERLTVASRFCEADLFLQYLLAKVMDFPTILNSPADASQDDRLFDFLIFLFPSYLRAALRKGPFKKYVNVRHNDDRLRGTINVSRHIRENTPFVGTVAYDQRELSYDNDLMELIRHTVEYVKGRQYGRLLLANVRDEVRLVVAATPGYRLSERQKVVEKNAKSPVRHAYYREYLALQKLCLLILRHRRHQIGSGAHQIYGVLVDGAWLWEEYLNTLIGEWFHHPKNKSRQGAQYLFSGSIGLIYPDFIGRDAQHRMIADAKYKPVGNINGSDYQQVLAYMLRFDAKSGFYLYPDKDGETAKTLWVNQGSTYESDIRPRDDLRIVKLGLAIPQNAVTHGDFAEKMAESERQFLAAFRQSVEQAPI